MPPILDVAIGTIFVFLLFSLVVSVLNEVILSLFDQRAKFLHMGLQELLGEAKDKKFRHWRNSVLARVSGGLLTNIKLGELTKRLYEHGLINAFWRTDKASGSPPPSYIPAGAFVIALLDIIRKPGDPKPTPQVVTGSQNAVSKNLFQSLLVRLIASLESMRDPKAQTNTAEEVRKIMEGLKQTINALPSEKQIQVKNLKDKLASSNLDAGSLLEIAKDLKNVVDPPDNDEHTKENIEKWINNLGNFPDLQESLRSLFTAVDKDVVKFKTAVEGWFNDSMGRVSGWYKRFAQTWMIVIAFVLAATLNVDTVHIVEVLSKSPNLAKAVASQAASYVQQGQRPQMDELALKKAQAAVQDAQAALDKAQESSDQSKIAVAQKQLDAAKEAADPEAEFHAAIAKLSDTGIPMGWDDTQLKVLDLDRKDLTLGKLLKSIQSDPGATSRHWLDWSSGHISLIASLTLGWFITALAASLGAPFWFDILSRFMNVRNAGKLPGEKDPTSTAAKPPATLDSTPGTPGSVPAGSVATL